jgi:DUF4097 and DUF4098 domain-containing protein YvlB
MRTLCLMGLVATGLGACVVALRVQGSADPVPIAQAELSILASGDGAAGTQALDQTSLAFAPNGGVLDLAFAPGSVEGVTLDSLTLGVPAGSTLDLATSNGGIVATGLTGAVTASSSNGAVQIATNGTVTATTSNGSVQIETGGTVTIDTSNGRVSGTFAGGTAHTSNGSVELTWTGTLAPLEVETSNGGVTIHVPATANFDADLDTSNADVTVNVGATHVQSSHYQGLVGSGGVTLRVRSSNGGITVTDQ